MTAAVLQGAAQAAGEAAGTGHASPVTALVGLVVGLMVVAAVVDLAAKRLAVPFTVALVVAGALLAIVAERVPLLSSLASVDVTPDAVFFVFLPALIFQSAFHLDARALRANLGPTLTLAVPGLLISTGQFPDLELLDPLPVVLHVPRSETEDRVRRIRDPRTFFRCFASPVGSLDDSLNRRVVDLCHHL